MIGPDLLRDAHKRAKLRGALLFPKYGTDHRQKREAGSLQGTICSFGHGRTQDHRHDPHPDFVSLDVSKARSHAAGYYLLDDWRERAAGRHEAGVDDPDTVGVARKEFEHLSRMKQDEFHERGLLRGILHDLAER